MFRLATTTILSAPALPITDQPDEPVHAAHKHPINRPYQTFMTSPIFRGRHFANPGHSEPGEPARRPGGLSQETVQRLLLQHDLPPILASARIEEPAARVG